MFWDRVAGVYDIFANVINAKAHRELCANISGMIEPDDDVLECACGTGLITYAVAPHCRSIIATDFSENMLKRTRKKCAAFSNVSVQKADIRSLGFSNRSFDKVIAGNVIHLLDEPYQAISELARVCKTGGQLIIPTYINESRGGDTSGFANVVGKAGADFKRQFTFETYKVFFEEAGYRDGSYMMIEGKVPCAIAVINKGVV